MFASAGNNNVHAVYQAGQYLNGTFSALVLRLCADTPSGDRAYLEASSHRRHSDLLVPTLCNPLRLRSLVYSGVKQG